METKRNFLFVPLLLAVAMASMLIAFSSCGEEDGEPLSFALSLYVENESGENLLDPVIPGNLVGNLEANLSYEGKTYPVCWDEFNDPFLSEHCKYPKGLPGGHFHGIWYETHRHAEAQKNRLEIGTFYGPDFKHKRFTVDLPKYGLKYDFDLNIDKPELKVNGKKAEIWDEYTIVLPAEKK